MQKSTKFKPTDSEKEKKEDSQAAKEPKDRVYQRKEADMDSPARKKKFSEQPPSRHNSKT